VRKTREKQQQKLFVYKNFFYVHPLSAQKLNFQFSRMFSLSLSIRMYTHQLESSLRKSFIFFSRTASEAPDLLALTKLPFEKR
jgi:hypothetical protein